MKFWIITFACSLAVVAICLVQADANPHTALYQIVGFSSSLLAVAAAVKIGRGPK